MSAAAFEALFVYYLAGFVASGLGGYLVYGDLTVEGQALYWVGLALLMSGSVVLQIGIVASGVLLGLRIRDRQAVERD